MNQIIPHYDYCNVVSEQGANGILWTLFEAIPFASRRVASFATEADARYFIELCREVRAYKSSKPTEHQWMKIDEVTGPTDTERLVPTPINEKHNLATDAIIRIEKYYQLSLGTTARDIVIQAMDKLRDGIPAILCLCGSMRFVEEFEQSKERLESSGFLVIGPHVIPESNRDKYRMETCGRIQRGRILLCDELYVINKSKYIGESTKAEIAYAESLGKMIKYMEPL
jgi:hypothetical protein